MAINVAMLRLREGKATSRVMASACVQLSALAMRQPSAAAPVVNSTAVAMIDPRLRWMVAA